MIEPTIGRRVWYVPSAYDRGDADAIPSSQIKTQSGQPCDAGVVHVWGDRCVNLLIADHDGNLHRRTSVTLVQDGDAPPPGGGYAMWMPYQQAAAAKAA